MPPETIPAKSSRLVIHQATKQSDQYQIAPLAEDVRKGLTAQPKTLPPKYFYDALGSQLFEAICHLPEYYLTKAETEIFQRYSGEIVHQFSSATSLVELGSGSAVKSRYLIDAFLKRQAHLHYQPIDISATILEQSAQTLLQLYPGLRITGRVCDYTQSIPPIERQGSEKILVLFLGSNIGNYNPDEAQALLRAIRRKLRPGDGLLLGADLKKPVEILEPAYNDVLGVTAAFNLNLLSRINRELGANFDITRFEHRAFYNALFGRIEIHLVSRLAQTVNIDSLGLQIDFQEGETIHTENSYKYDHLQLAALAARTGFQTTRTWLDSKERFSCNLWMAID